MALPLTGTIRWEVNPLYPGITPVSIKHYNEVLNYIDLVDEVATEHILDTSYVAHGRVNLLESGFMTPELVKRINDIEDAIQDVKDRVYNRLPVGVIVMWDGKKSEIPENWVLCDGNNFTPNLINKFVLGGSHDDKYPLHEENANGLGSNLATLFTTSKLTNHTHSYFNAYYCENATNSGFVTKTDFGRTYGSNDSDWDNSLAYVNAYTDYAGTAVTASTFQDVKPPFIQTYYIMYSYGEGDVKITVNPPSSGYGYVTINGEKVSGDNIYPRGMRLTIEFIVPHSHEVTKYQLNGEDIEYSIKRIALFDSVIDCETVLKQCNVTVVQNSLGVTTVNNEVITSKDYPYNTKLSINTVPVEDYLIGGYTITYKGYKNKVSTAAIAKYGLKRAAELAAEEIDKSEVK